MDLGHVPKVFREPVETPGLAETKTSLSVNIARVEFHLDGLRNNAVHISGFHGEDGRIVELNSVFLADTVFSYGRLLLMFQSDVLLMLV
jgi:hypothetical protein